MVITTLNIVNIFHFTFLIFYLFYFTILRHVLKNKPNYININVFLAPLPKDFHQGAGWEECSRCTHSSGMVCRGGQERWVKLVHVVPFQSVSLSVVHLTEPVSSSATAVYVALMLLSNHSGDFSRSHKKEGGTWGKWRDSFFPPAETFCCLSPPRNRGGRQTLKSNYFHTFQSGCSAVLLSPRPLGLCVAFRVMCPDGWTAGSPAAGNKGCRARPPSQRRTGKPCGPAPRLSGVGRNPWQPDRTGWRPPPRWSPCGWSHAAVWWRAAALRKRTLPFGVCTYH